MPKRPAWLDDARPEEAAELAALDAAMAILRRRLAMIRTRIGSRRVYRVKNGIPLGGPDMRRQGPHQRARTSADA